MNIHYTDRQKKKMLIASVVGAFQKHHPHVLKQIAKDVEEMAKNEFNPKTGALKGDNSKNHKGYIKVRVPQELFFVLRHFFPTFGDDSEDLKLLAEEFPKLCHHREVIDQKRRRAR